MLVDWGAQTFSGYKSDLTRTLFTQPPTREFEKVYQTVLKAQGAGHQGDPAGAKCSVVDGKARGLIAAAGLRQVVRPRTGAWDRLGDSRTAPIFADVRNGTEAGNDCHRQAGHLSSGPGRS